jgi:exodeoxyribonuclease V gamma subunit
VRPDLARQCLELLARLRAAGLREPLPMALETSAEYAGRRHGGAAVADATPAASQRWEADRFRPERDEPEHVLVFGAKAPFTHLTAQPPLADEQFDGESTRFGSLARWLWTPLITAETDVLP